MNELRNYDSMLKRFLKRKVKVTDALIVAFLITGAVGFAAPGIDEVPKTPAEAGITAPVAPTGPTGPVIPQSVLDKLENRAKFSDDNNFGFGDPADGYGAEISNEDNFDDLVIGSEYKGGIFAGQNGWQDTWVDNEGTITGEGWGMLASSFIGFDVEVENKGTIATTGDVGMGAIYGGQAENEGVIKNTGDFGMLAAGYNVWGPYYSSEAENSGIIKNTGDFGMAAVNGGEAYNYGTIQNGGNHGMVAFDNGEVENSGVIKNDGDFGMTAIGKWSDADNEEQGIIENNGKFGIAAFFGAEAENHDDAVIRNNGDFGMVAVADFDSYNDGYETVIENSGMIQNKGNFGMAAFDGAEAFNYQLIQNDGNFGMVASGMLKGENGEIEDYSYAENDGGVIINNGDFGMAAFGNGEVYNNGYIANKGDFAMVAVGGEQIKGNFDSLRSSDPYDYAYFARSEAYNDDHIANEGDFGMAAFDGAYAENMDTIANLGNFGMAAIGGTVAIRKNPGDFEHEYFVRSEARNEDDILNDGDFGMVAFDGAYVRNSEEGFIKNDGDFGMVAIGEKDLELTYESLAKDTGTFSYTANSVAWNDGDIKNTGDFGMAAFDGGIAINSGDIENAGDGGMLISGNSIGWNLDGEIDNDGNVGVYMTGNSTFINDGYVGPKNFNEDEVKYAVLAGNGDNTIYMGGEMDGKVHGGIGGTDTLLYDNLVGYDYYTVDGPSNSFGHINYFGDVVDNTFSHIGVGFDRYSNDEPVTGAEDLIIDRDLVLKTSHNTNKTDYNAVDGKISYDKFNGFEYTHINYDENDFDSEFDTDMSSEWKDNIYVNNGRFDGDIHLEEGKNITLTLGQNRVSVLGANSINGTPSMTIETDHVTGGTITQRTLDNFFITDASEIEVRNILLGTPIRPEFLSTGIIPEGEDGYDYGNFNIDEMLYENLADGWTAYYEQNEDGSISTHYVRTGDISGYALAGGYGESFREYTQSNVDIMNGLKIKDAGYTYARKFAFLEPEVTTTSTTTMKETTNIVAKGKEMVALPATTPEVVTTTTETPYNWLQFGEIFGEAGKYDGNTNAHFDYDTFGVTGGTFGRITDRWTAGLTYGYAHSKVDYSNGDEKVDSLGINGFLSNRYENWLATLGLGYTWSKHDLSRHNFDRDSLADQSILGTNHLSADFDSHIINLGAELGYNFKLSEQSSLYPYVGFDYIWYNREAYSEKGAGNLALKLDETDYGIPMSKLGAQFEHNMDRWNFSADLAWIHMFHDNADEASTLANFHNLHSNAKWELPGLDIGKDTGILNLAVNYDVTENFTVGVDYTGYLRDSQWGNKGGLKFDYKW